MRKCIDDKLNEMERQILSKAQFQGQQESISVRREIGRWDKYMQSVTKSSQFLNKVKEHGSDIHLYNYITANRVQKFLNNIDGEILRQGVQVSSPSMKFKTSSLIQSLLETNPDQLAFVKSRTSTKMLPKYKPGRYRRKNLSSTMSLDRLGRR